MILEVACFSIEAAVIAEKAGADRIEFCLDYAVGGVSPPVSDVVEIKKKTVIPVFVMIRPRQGNFFYTNEEIRIMTGMIDEMKDAGADGFVFGVLKPDNELNVKECKKLVNKAYPLPCTLHRAFDDTPDLMVTLQHAIDSGFKRILCSGGKGNAPDNIDMLTDLVEKAAERIIIMPGGGIRSKDIPAIRISGTGEFHTSSITGSGYIPDPEEIRKIKFELKQG